MFHLNTDTTSLHNSLPNAPDWMLLLRPHHPNMPVPVHHIPFPLMIPAVYPPVLPVQINTHCKHTCNGKCSQNLLSFICYFFFSLFYFLVLYSSSFYRPSPRSLQLLGHSPFFTSSVGSTMIYKMLWIGFISPTT